MHQPDPLRAAGARTRRRHPHFFSAVPALLLGALCWFNPPPAEAQNTYPDQPQNVQLSPGSGSLTLTWEEPLSWGDYPKDRYEIDWRVGDDGDWSRPSGSRPSPPDPGHAATSYTFEGTYGSTTVTNGVKYCLRIRAVSRRASPPDDPDVPGHYVVVCGTPVAEPAATIARGTSPVTEGTAASFTVTLSSAAPSGGITVSLTVADATGSDFVASTNEGAKTLAFSSGESSKTYTVATVADSTDEANGDVTVTVGSGTGYTVGSPSSATVTVNDDDPPAATITRGTSPVTEGTAASFTVTLSSAAPSGGITVSLTVADATGSDFVASANEGAKTLEFSSGESSKTYTVATVADTTDEANGDVTVTVGTGTGYTVGSPASASVTVNDDDGAPTVTLSLSPMSISENGGSSTVTASLSAASSATVTVTVSAQAVSPAQSGDFTLSAARTLTIAAGSTTSTGVVTIRANDNNVDAPDKTVTVSGTASGGGVSDPNDVELILTDDDLPTATITAGASPVTEGTAASFTVTLSSAAPSGGITVNLTVADVAGSNFVVAANEGPKTLAFSVGESAKTYTVATVDDGADEANGEVTVTVASGTGYTIGTPGSASVTVNDNDGTLTVTLSLSPASITENSGVSTVTASLSAASSAAVTVTVSAQAVSPAQAGDFTLSSTRTLTIAAGSTTSSGVVTIRANDNDVDAPDRTVRVSGSASGGGVSDPMPVTLTIEDDDDPAPTTMTVRLALNPASITENGGVSTVTASLSAASSAAVTVTVSAQAVSPAQAGDFTLSTARTLTIAAGSTTSTGTVTIRANDNDVDASDKTVRVSGSASGGGVADPAPMALTLTDDDARGVTVAPTSLAVGERETETYTLVLTSEPTEPVKVAVASSSPLLAEASPADLTFTASNWSQEQTVTVMALAAGSAELTHQVISTGDYASVTASSVSVTVHSLLGSVNDELLPRIAQAMMSSTLSAISRRMDMANPNVDSEGPHTFGGQASLEQALASLATAAKGATSLDLRRALGGKEFVLPFGGAAGGTRSAAEVWGRGDYRNLKGGDDRPVRWDGDLTSIHAGVDWEVRPGLLAGVMVSWSDGKFDWQNRGDRREGTYDSGLTSAHPYVSWLSFENALQAWATVGYGRGEVEIDDGSGKRSSDTRLKTAAVGVSAVLASEHNQIMFGTSTLRIKAEGNVTEIKADGGDGINPLTADIDRIRVVLEGRHVCERGPDEWLIPWVEAGARHDGGDGLTGTGMEVGTGVRYSNAAKGLTAEGEARYLISHSDDYHEWGFHGEIRIDPGTTGRGLSFRLAPSLGQPQTKAASLWARDGPGRLPTGGRQSVDGRLDAQIEYGLPAVEGRGLLTPYARLSLAGRSGDFRIGSRLEIGSMLGLNIEGGRFGEAEGSSDLGIGFFIQLLDRHPETARKT